MEVRRWGAKAVASRGSLRAVQSGFAANTGAVGIALQCRLDGEAVDEVRAQRALDCVQRVQRSCRFGVGGRLKVGRRG